MVVLVAEQKSRFPSIIYHVFTGRWFMVFASNIIMSMAGATYMFGLYSGDIKSSLAYDQTTLNLLSFFKDFGGNIGIISGLINEVAPPWVVLSIGAIMNFSGYFMMWLAVTKHISKPPVWQMCLFICIGANSQAFSNTGALVTCVKNFPESRGVVIGILKGFVGLSGAILTQIYHALYGHDSKAIILLIGWLPAAVSFVFLRTIRIMDVVRQVNEVKIFYNLLYLSLSLAGFLMVLIIMQNSLTFTHSEYSVSACIVLILLFVGPLFVVINEDYKIWKRKNQVLKDQSQLQLQVIATENPPMVESGKHTDQPPETLPGSNQDSIPQPAIQKEKPPTQSGQEEVKKVSCFRTAFMPPERGDDYTILQAIFSIDMLIIFLTTTFGVGGTLTAIDNLGQIGKAQGYPRESISTFISLVSIWNYLGRVTSGFGSEHLLTKYKIPRPLILTIVLLISCIGHLLIAFAIPNSLYVASVIMGFCFGAQWPLIFAIISEIFGLKYYSTLFNLGGGASPVGVYILNVVVAGHLYDKEAMKQNIAKGLKRKAGEDLSCNGVECYKQAFLIITAATFFACAVSFILVFRTRKFYKGDIYNKFKQQNDVVDSELNPSVSANDMSTVDR